MAGSQLFRYRSDFGATIDAAADRLGISATAIEKDYWVGEVLRILASEFSGDFLLKGGTSLSKGFGLIQRFSEDIDILVLAGDRGRGAVDKLMKRIADEAAAGIDGSASPIGGAESGRHRAYEISYPALREATDLVRTSVLLEMGTRGGTEPSEIGRCSGLLGKALADSSIDLAEFADVEGFELALLHPGRTLLEKLAAVHAEAMQIATDPELVPSRNAGRHFYDIHELLADTQVAEFLADQDGVRRIIDEITSITQAHFAKFDTPAEVRPADGFAQSPAFKLDSDISARLRASYEETMPQLYFGSDPLPSWEAIVERVIQHGELL